MDSHLIYTASEALRIKVIWSIVTPESEWLYFLNSDNEINENLVRYTINNHFIDDSLLIAFTRKESIEVNKNSIIEELKNNLKEQSFLVWDREFLNTIEFNKIGTLRCGQLKSDN